MNLAKLCKIAAHTSTIRIAVSYCGDDRFAVGIGDGVTSPIVANGTPEEIESILTGQLPGYLEKAATEAAERKAKADEAKRQAEERVALAELKRKNNERKAAEKKAAEANKEKQMQLDLF